ncbi:hypothetical protein F4802DRAFT_90552 [Xylaria palmicola]|nr:hypothetical protein F4802DRAFT_90552 [Xylaria palmicola]
MPPGFTRSSNLSFFFLFFFFLYISSTVYFSLFFCTFSFPISPRARDVFFSFSSERWKGRGCHATGIHWCIRSLVALCFLIGIVVVENRW